MRCYSVRPMFLGCCVLSCKMTREHDVPLTLMHGLLKDVFDLLDVVLLAKIEHQLLEVRTRPACVLLVTWPFHFPAVLASIPDRALTAHLTLN